MLFFRRNNKLILVIRTSPKQNVVRSTRDESKKIFSEVISQKLNSPDLKYNEETFDVIYTKKGNTWEISPEKNEKLLKALTLGIQM